MKLCRKSPTVLGFLLQAMHDLHICQLNKLLVDFIFISFPILVEGLLEDFLLQIGPVRVFLKLEDARVKVLHLFFAHF